MTAAREQIFAELDDRLGALVEAGCYEREATGDPDSEKLPVLYLFDYGQSPEDEAEVGTDRLGLRIRVEGFVKASTGAAAHAALNELHALTVAAVMDDQTLGGRAESIDIGAMLTDRAELGSEWRFAFVQDFDIQFSTPRGDPSQFA